jgi:nucleotide-binding universal stress UspA family protein
LGIAATRRVSEGCMMIIRNILVPTDFSEQAQAAARVAADLSRAHHAGVTLLHVHELTTFELPEGYVSNMPSELGRVHEELNQRLAESERELRSLGVQRVETRVLNGAIVDEIVKFSSDFDYIVIGTHGRSALQRLFLGSVAQKVLERASCMVVVVRSAQGPG